MPVALFSIQKRLLVRKKVSVIWLHVLLMDPSNYGILKGIFYGLTFLLIEIKKKEIIKIINILKTLWSI